MFHIELIVFFEKLLIDDAKVRARASAEKERCASGGYGRASGKE
jgi:hypothetical protein